MNPLRLRAKNFRTFGDLDVELPAGCAAITGANGAGKSSLISLVDLCLFGPDGRSWAPYLTQGAESTELEVELTFEHAGDTYRVRRGYSARGAGKTALDLERLLETRTGNGLTASEAVAASWEPVTREGQKATQELVEEILGLTRETFRASAMLVQGDGGAFTEAKPADRKRVLGAVLGLDRFDRLGVLVKRDRKAADATVERLNGALERADAELAEKPTVERQLGVTRQILADAAKQQTKFEADLQAAAQAAAKVERDRAARAEAEAAVAAAVAALQPLEQRLADAVDAERELGVAADEVEALATVDQRAELERFVASLEGEIERYRSLLRERAAAGETRALRQRERDAIAAQARAKSTEASKLEEQASHVAGGDLAHCPTCEQTLGADAKTATVGNLRARAQAAADEAKALDEQAAGVDVPALPPEPEPPVEVEQTLAAARTRLEKARQDELQRERLAGRTQALRERAARKPADADVEKARRAAQGARSAAAALPPAPDAAELQALQAAALTARARVETERGRYDAAKADEIRAASLLERLTELEASVADDRKARAELLSRVDRLAVLERAYGRDGIPSLIIQGAAIPAIEAEAGRILEELGTSYRVELRTARVLADGGTADALDVVVVTDAGERAYETFSGGERTRLNLSLRIALARLLASRRGAESRILAIDEPDGLDEAGMAALVRVLEGLNGSFDRTYLISHHPELQTAFSQTLLVRRDGGGLSVVEAA